MRTVRAFLKDSPDGARLWRSGWSPSATLAISILRERRIDLIVGDAASLEPGRGKTLRKLRRSQRGTKILAMTGDLPVIASAAAAARRGFNSAQRLPRFQLMEPDRLKARLFLGAHAILPETRIGESTHRDGEKTSG